MKWQSIDFTILATGALMLPLACMGQVNYEIAPGSMRSVIEQVEADSNLRFYFAHEWIDSLNIKSEINAGSTQELLTTLHDLSDLYFNQLGEKIIITPNTPILKDLSFDSTSINGGYLFEREYLNENFVGETQVVGSRAKMNSGGQSVLAGFVRSQDNNEPVVGAVVYLPKSDRSVVTDVNGFYSINLPTGKHEVRIQRSGMDPVTQMILVFSDGSMDFSLTSEATLLEEVSILAEADANISNVVTGITNIDMDELKNVPKVLGENDIVQIALTLPGVQNLGEGSSGINVRGGKTDQNLILFNNATVYNPFHFFGFFSSFNADVMGESELYKGSIPVTFGGRLSSILDVKIKEGSKDEFKAKAGISPVTSRVSVEIPIWKDKTSIIAGIRTTYSDWILNRVKDENIRNSDPSFFDLAVGIHHRYGENNSLEVSGYFSKDQFRLTPDSVYAYHNLNASLAWQHILDDKWSVEATASLSQYAFSVENEQNPISAFKYGFEINDIFAQVATLYLPNEKHEIAIGADTRHYLLNPGFFNPSSSESIVIQEQIQKERGLESAIFLSDNYKITESLNAYLGFRYSFYNALGGRSVNYYEDGELRAENSRIATRTFSENEIINSYRGPEARLALRYNLTPVSSIKSSYNLTRQYIHALSNNVSISPIDTWKLSDPNFLPQSSQQFSLGYFRNFHNNGIETSLEAYYKTFDNLVDFKVGADLVLNDQLETDAIQGVGRAYGLELLIKKNTGKLTGWLGYTYSRSQQKFSSNFREETINRGEYFSSNFEKPHDVSLVTNYKYNRRFSFSVNVLYSTGRPVTYPTAKYLLSGTEAVHFSDRNQFRIPDYFRIDIAINVEGSHKIKKLAHSYWSFSVYNLTARNNVYSVFFSNNNGEIQGYELSVLGAAIPSISYNLKF